MPEQSWVYLYCTSEMNASRTEQRECVAELDYLLDMPPDVEHSFHNLLY